MCKVLWDCARRLTSIICGIHPFWRRSACGALLCWLLYRRRGGIRRLWQGIELRRIPFFRHLRSSTFPVKVHMLVAGETFQVHETFMQKLKLQIELCSAESSSVILVFCPVVSRIGTDMEAAMARVPEDKPVILVFMHHCHHPSHMTNITVQPSRSNIVIVVHCAFHQHEGLLRCDENNKAVDMVCSELKKHQ